MTTFKRCLTYALIATAAAVVPMRAQERVGTPAPAPARYFNPRFSTDATRVIFESTRDGKPSVFSANVDGSDLKRLTDGKQNDAQPQWSADGSIIVYTSDVEKLTRVFVMKPDGAGRRQVSAGPRFDIGPAISPDNKWIAWGSTTVDPVNWRDIGVAPADGSQPQRLITSGPGNDLSPVWISATRIVFVRDLPPKTDWNAMTPEDQEKRRASSEIMAVDVDGSHLANLTNNSVSDTAPSWAASLERVFFVSTRKGSPELFSMNADGSDVRRVADAAGISPAVSSDGRLMTYSKTVDNRSGIYVRDLASGVEREVVGGNK